MNGTPGDVSEDFLTCALCHDEYDDPRALDCLHAFCKSCISDHIVKSTKDQRAPTTFDCPVCKRAIQAPDPHQMPSLWAGLLPVSHLLTSLMDSVRLRNDVSKCEPCFRRKEKVIAAKWCKECAEALCDKCVQFHKSLKYSQKHTLMDFEELRQQPIKNTLPRPPCPQHENTTLGFFCEDHQKVCCSSCVTLDHRKCSHVTTSADAAARYRNDVDSLMDKLRHQNGWSVRIKESRQHSLKLLKDAENQLRNQIVNIRKQFDELLLNQEKIAMNELKAVEAREKQKYQQEIRKCEEVISTTSNALNILKNSTQNGTDAGILLTVNNVKKEAQSCEVTLTDLSRNLTDILLIFTQDRMLSQVLGTLKELGKISISETHVHVQPPYTLNAQDFIKEPEQVTSTDHNFTGSSLENTAKEQTKSLVDGTPRSSRMSQNSQIFSRQSRNSQGSEATSSRQSPALKRSRHTSTLTHSRLSSKNSKLLNDTPRSDVSKGTSDFRTTIEGIKDETMRRSTSRMLSPVTPMGRDSDRKLASNPAALEFFFKVIQANHFVYIL